MFASLSVQKETFPCYNLHLSKSSYKRRHRPKDICVSKKLHPYSPLYFANPHKDLIPKWNEKELKQKLAEVPPILKIDKSSLPGAGNGLFTTKEIKCGTPISMYGGEIKDVPWITCMENLLDPAVHYLVGLPPTKESHERKHIAGEYLSPLHENGLAQIINDAGCILEAGGFLQSGSIRSYIMDVQNRANVAVLPHGKESFVAVALENISPGDELLSTYRSYWWLMEVFARIFLRAQFVLGPLRVLGFMQDSKKYDAPGAGGSKFVSDMFVSYQKALRRISEESAECLHAEQEMLLRKGLFSSDSIRSMQPFESDLPPWDTESSEWGLYPPHERELAVDNLGVLDMLDTEEEKQFVAELNVRNDLFDLEREALMYYASKNM
mmetsp:Transcript_24430/g.33673  ORF Transcript_24430/g.33673 Transcript_24430/m.33673 type:complete len:381 (+) Transcript_24430:99-1241(+)